MLQTSRCTLKVGVHRVSAIGAFARRHETQMWNDSFWLCKTSFWEGMHCSQKSLKQTSAECSAQHFQMHNSKKHHSIDINIIIMLFLCKMVQWRTWSVLGSVDKEKAEGLGDSTKGPLVAPALECLGLTSRLLGLLLSPTRLGC